jgi:hypothetical protein
MNAPSSLRSVAGIRGRWPETDSRRARIRERQLREPDRAGRGAPAAAHCFETTSVSTAAPRGSSPSPRGREKGRGGDRPGPHRARCRASREERGARARRLAENCPASNGATAPGRSCGRCAIVTDCLPATSRWFRASCRLRSTCASMRLRPHWPRPSATNRSPRSAAPVGALPVRACAPHRCLRSRGEGARAPALAPSSIVAAFPHGVEQAPH